MEQLFPSEYSDMDDESLGSGWARLPCEVLLQIFSFLDAASLRSAGSVSWHWASVARSDNLWYLLLRRQWVDAARLRGRLGKASFWDVCRWQPAIDKAWDKGLFLKEDLAVYDPPRSLIDFCQVGREIVACGLNKTLRVSNMHSKAVTADLIGHEHHVSHLELLQGSLLASSSYDATIQLWDGGRGWVRCGILAGHLNAVLETKRLQRGGQLLSRGRDGTLRLWDTEKLQSISCFRGHAGPVTGVRIVSLGQEQQSQFLSSGRDGTVRLWDVRTGGAVAKWTLHTADVYALHHPSFETMLAVSCSADSTMVVMDMVAGKMVKSFTCDEVPYCVRLDRGRLLAGGGGGSLLVSEEIYGPVSQVKALRPPGNTDWACNALRMVNHRPITGYLDGSLVIWDTNLKPVAHLPLYHNGVLRKLKADPFSIRSCGYDGKIKEINFQGAPEAQSYPDESEQPTRGCSIA